MKQSCERKEPRSRGEEAQKKLGGLWRVTLRTQLTFSEAMVT